MQTTAIQTETLDIQALQSTWAAFDRLAHLRPIHNDDEYDRTVALMNHLVDTVGDSDHHPLAGLLDLVSNLVEDYDSTHFAIEPTEPLEMLRYLMEQRGLSQSDLAGVVPQGNLSAILAGKRKISLALAKKLAAFFRVSPAVFI